MSNKFIRGRGSAKEARIENIPDMVPGAPVGLIPEHKLIANIFAMAVRDAIAGHKDTVRWLNNKSMEPYSCLWICEQLGFSKVEMVRKAIALPGFKMAHVRVID